MTKKEHIGISIGIRNDMAFHEHLWCEHCGQTESLGLPDEMDIVTLRMKNFRKRHKDCPI